MTDKLRNPKIFQHLPIKTVKFSNNPAMPWPISITICS